MGIQAEVYNNLSDMRKISFSFLKSARKWIKDPILLEILNITANQT